MVPEGLVEAREVHWLTRMDLSTQSLTRSACSAVLDCGIATAKVYCCARLGRTTPDHGTPKFAALASVADGLLVPVVAVDQSTVASTRAALGVPAPKSAAGTGVREARVS